MARGAEACAAMVARADLRLAEAAVPDRPRHADISRSDLSQSLCSDARRAEEGSDGTVAYKAADASRQRRQGQEWTRAHTRYGLYPRATRRGRGSRSSWPLGRRSSYRSKRHAHRDARRTPQPLYDARQAHPQIARAATTLPDVGPRQGDVWPQTLHGCHQRAGLLL